MAKLTRKEFGEMIKTKYPQYADVDTKTLADKVIDKYPQYREQVKKGGPFKDIGRDIRETIQGVRGAIKETGQRQKEAIEFGARGEQTGAESVGQFAGQTLRGLSNIVGEIGLGAAKVVAPQRLEEAVGGVVERVAQSQPVQGALQSIEQFKQNNPRAGRNVDALLGVAELGLDVVGAGVGKQAATGVTRGVRATGRAIGTGAEIAGDIAKPTARFTASQLTGLQPDTLSTIFRNADMFEEFKATNLDRFRLANATGEALDTRIKNLSELGSQYDVIRQSGDVVELPQSWLEQQIKNSGFIVKDGKVRANTKSPTRDVGDVRALQNLYDNWAGKDVLEADEFLNLRADLRDLSRFGKEIGSSDTVESLTRSYRASLNEFRDQIDGLADIDAQYAPEVKELNALKKDLFDKEGNLKDSAINKIANATGKGKDPLLDRLRQLDPNIETKIKTLKAIEDVEYASGRAVGAYTRGAIGAGLAVTGNIPAGLALFVAGNPQISTRFISWYARNVDPSVAKYVGSITTKIQNGTKLAKDEIEAMAKIIQADQVTVDDFIQSIGISAGIGADQIDLAE